MKINNRKLDIVSLSILLNIAILFLAMFFPTLDIFGYTHEVSEPTNPSLVVTITPTSLFTMLSNSFYSIAIKSAYVCLFVFQILSILLLVVSVAFMILNKRKIYSLLCLFSFITILIEAILIISLFNTYILPLGITIVCLIITIGIFVLNVLSRANRKYNKNVSSQNE